MPVRSPCPKCTTVLALPDGLDGKQVRCPKCGENFALPSVIPAEESIPVLTPATGAGEAIQGAPPPRAVSPVVLKRMEERPDRYKRQRPENKGYAGATVVILGAVALVGLFVVCAGTLGFGAWLMGGRNAAKDQAAIKPGAVAPPLVKADKGPQGGDPGIQVVPPAPLFQPPPAVDFKPPPVELKPPPVGFKPPPVEFKPQPPAAKVPDLPPFKEAANPFRDGTQTKVRPLKSVKAPGNAVQLAFSPRSGLLFLRTNENGMWVLDTKAQQVVGMQAAQHKFTDLSLAPDESVLFAADYGGTNIGYGSPRQPSYVHRFDLATRKWEKRQAPRIAFRVEAVDASRLLLLEQDQWVKLTLNRWEANPAVTELGRIGCDYFGDIEYDPRTGRLYHGNSGSSSKQISVRHILGDQLTDGGNTGTYGTANKEGGGSATLSSDGSRFYYGRLQVEALDVKHNLRSFPEPILAASRDLAFGKRGYYNAQTAAPVGQLGFEPGALAVSRDGMVLWAYNPATTTLHQFALEGDR